VLVEMLLKVLLLLRVLVAVVVLLLLEETQLSLAPIILAVTAEMELQYLELFTQVAVVALALVAMAVLAEQAVAVKQTDLMVLQIQVVALLVKQQEAILLLLLVALVDLVFLSFVIRKRRLTNGTLGRNR
jgi:hypothetical protein